MKLHNIIQKILLGLAVLLLIFIIITTWSIASDPDITLQSTFAKLHTNIQVFDTPIKAFAGLVVVLSLYITFYRSRQFEEQAELNRHHLQMSNYYRQQDEFKKIIEDLGVTSNPSFYRNLYQTWFGLRFDTDNKIQEHVAKQAKEFLALIDNAFYEGTEVSLPKIIELLQKLGFGELLKEKRVVIKRDFCNSEIYHIARVISYTFKFSDQFGVIKDFKFLEHNNVKG